MGLLDALNGDLQSGMQSPLFNLGAGLIAGAQPFANPGQALMGAASATQAEQARQQQLYMQSLQLQMLKQQWPYMQSLFSQLGGLMGPPQGGNSAPATPGKGQSKGQKAATPMPVSAPVAGPFSPMPSAAPSPPSVSASAAPGVGSAGAPASGLADPMALQRFGLMASMFPMTQPMGKAAQAAATFAAQYSPQLQARLAAAKSALAQDQLLMQQAQASGDVLAYKGALNKYLTDSKLLSIGSYNGNVTTAQGITPAQVGISTLSPSQGVQINNGQASPIPGMIGAREALAGAQARGAAQGDVERVWDPQTQQWGYVPRSALLGGPSGAPSASPGAGPLTAGPNPMQAAYLAGTGRVGSEQVGSLQNAANGAQRANFQLAQILRDSQDVVTGPTAGARKWMDTAVASVTQLFGVAPPKSLASYQELDKYGNQLAFAMTRQLGSREAGQIVQLEMESNPNKSNVPAALRDLVGSAHAANDFVIAQNLYVQTVAQRNGGNAELGQANWTSNTDPRVWQLAISPEMAAKWAPRIGLPKVAKVMPYMLPETAYDAFRNLPRASQVALTKRLDPSFMQAMVNAAQ